MRLEMEIDKVEELYCDKAGRLLGASCKNKKKLRHELTGVLPDRPGVGAGDDVA